MVDKIQPLHLAISEILRNLFAVAGISRGVPTGGDGRGPSSNPGRQERFSLPFSCGAPQCVAVGPCGHLFPALCYAITWRGHPKSRAPPRARIFAEGSLPRKKYGRCTSLSPFERNKNHR